MTGLLGSLYKLQEKDIKEAAATFADAFTEDPIWSALFAEFKDDHDRKCAVYENPVRYCMKYGSVYSTSERLEGIAAWVPGELSRFTLWRMLRSGALAAGMKVGFRIARKMMPIFKPIEADRNEHMKGKQFTYLQIIGVAREFQGRGFGGTLLRAVIDEAERMGRILYLETETERNVSMYERFGFEVIKRITLPVVDLPMWEMVRPGGT